MKDTEQVFFSGTTTDGTAKELFINGVANSRLSISDGTAKVFSVIIIAYEAATNSTVAYRGDGYIRRSGSTTTASTDNTTMIAYSGVLGWVAAVTADDVNDSLKITVTGAAGKTIKWKASVRMASV